MNETHNRLWREWYAAWEALERSLLEVEQAVKDAEIALEYAAIPQVSVIRVEGDHWWIGTSEPKYSEALMDELLDVEKRHMSIYVRYIPSVLDPDMTEAPASARTLFRRAAVRRLVEGVES